MKWLLVGVALLSLEAHAALYCAGRSLSDAYKDPQALALVKAAVRADVKKVAKLVADGANPNHQEDGSVPMLLWTLCAEELDGFEALLKVGADPNLAGNGHGKGDGVLGPKWSGRGTIIHEGWSAMLMAAATERIDYLRLAVAHGGNLDAQKGKRGSDRPLLEAAYYGLFENVKFLVQSGADVNVHHEKFQGETAPQNAIAVYARYDIAIWLLEQGYNHDLQGLAGTAEGRHVDTSTPEQRDKEKLIDLLRERGLEFPASQLIKAGLKTRIIPPEHVQDVIYGRRSVWDYPKRPGQENNWP